MDICESVLHTPIPVFVFVAVGFGLPVNKFCKAFQPYLVKMATLPCDTLSFLAFY